MWTISMPEGGAPLVFRPLEADDLFAIQRQASQRRVLGVDGAISYEDAQQLAGGPVAWSCERAGKLLACFGVVEQFPNVQGLAWALLAGQIGASHLALSRFAREALDLCLLPRIEALARGPDLEAVLAGYPGLDSGQIVSLARVRATPEMRWAQFIGLRPVHVLRNYGAACETYVLCERLFLSGSQLARAAQRVPETSVGVG
jgi:hypothetical protein